VSMTNSKSNLHPTSQTSLKESHINLSNVGEESIFHELKEEELEIASLRRKIEEEKER